jgi:hypothetical protein
MKTFFCTFVMAAASAAQSNPGAVGGALLGIVFDENAGAIRPLNGIPAAATLGPRLDTGADLEQAAAADGGYALAIEAATGAAVIVSASGRRSLTGVPPGASAIALSPRGSAAAFFFKASRTAYVVTGLPGSAGTPRPVIFDRQPLSLAVSDDGAALLALERNGRTGATILLYRDGKSPAVLHNGRAIAGMAFLPGSADVLIAESDAVRLVSEAFGPQSIAGEGDGIAGVVAAAGSADGDRVIIVMASGQVAIRDRKSNALATVSCACRPTALSRLRGAGVFRLNELWDGPLWLLDTDSPEPRILFVAGGAQ